MNIKSKIINIPDRCRFGMVTLILMFTFGMGLNAQTHYSSNVSFGAKGGVDFSEVMFNPSVKQKFQQGLVGGLMFRYIEENHFGIIAELNYVQRGWKENFEEAPYNYSRTINYVELPVMAHIFFGRRGRFFFNAGPQIGIFLSESTKSNFDISEISRLPDFPYYNRMNTQMSMPVTQKMDYGISAGLGSEFSINKRNSIALEARFYFGLGNIMPSKRSDVFGASNQMTVSATVGYWFRVK